MISNVTKQTPYNMESGNSSGSITVPPTISLTETDTTQINEETPTIPTEPKQPIVPMEPEDSFKSRHQYNRPEYGASIVGESIVILTPQELEERIRQEKKTETNTTEKTSTSFLYRIHSAAMRSVGFILRRIQTLDMHGGETGDNTKFVHGLIDFLGGTLGGAAQVYVSQPLDTVKVKQQAFPELYKSMVDCIVQTYRKDGIVHGLYAGSAPAVIANVAENSVLFTAYGSCQKMVTYFVGKKNVAELTILENAFAGCFAAFFSTFTLCPTELIKCKLQALREMQNFLEPGMARLRTPWGLTKHIYTHEGIAGFYRGLSSTFIREMPGYFCFFGGYEGTRELLRKPNQSKNEIGALRTMAAGAVGGTTLWVSIFPADVIKSRIQVKGLKKGMFAVGYDIIKHEGIFALYAGLFPTVLRTIPATATLFVVYEYTKKTLLNVL